VSDSFSHLFTEILRMEQRSFIR